MNTKISSTLFGLVAITIVGYGVLPLFQGHYSPQGIDTASPNEKIEFSQTYYDLRGYQKDFYQSCRSTMIKNKIRLLKLGNEKGCACLASKMYVEISSSEQLQMEAYFEVSTVLGSGKFTTSKKKSTLKNFYLAEYTGVKEKNRIHRKVRSMSREANDKCFSSSNQALAEQKRLLHLNFKTKKSGKMQYVTIVDKNGRSKRIGVSGNKGVSITGTGHGISIVGR
jgi:hypothetical protein